MKIPANQLSAHLRSPLLPCYLVSGDEPLLVQEATDSIRRKARDAGMDARELHVAEARFDWNELRSSAGNLSLFAERRIIELRLPTGKPGKQGGEAIEGLAEQAGDELLLIVNTPKLDRSAAASRWAKAIEKRGGHVQVWPVSVAELPRWIGERMRRVGLSPDRDAVQLLVDRVEGNLLAAQQEIDKLRLLIGAGKISAADVEQAVADSSRFDVYKLVDAALSGDAARAVRILGGLRGEGTEPVIVVWALSRELRTLSLLADSVKSGASLSNALQKAGVWKNRQGLVRSCVVRMQSADIYRLLKLARQADATAKGQAAGDPWAIAADIV
ncbi:MAG: DNA polymerase III subunit delta, partial [Gammaproteobacteria bacterium]|nr:DNA polymerase III subunit delta [Gammaproteobacteria bacterium]